MADRFFSYLLKNQVILALFLVLGGWLLFQTRGIITLIFLAYIINAALLPIVGYLRRKGIPPFFSAVIPFTAILLILFLIIFPLVPFVASQVSGLLLGLPTYLNDTSKMLGIDINVDQVQEVITRELNTLGRNAFAVTSRVFGGIFSVLTVLVVSFYLILYHDRFKKNISQLFRRSDRPRVLETLDLVDDKLGAWLQGQLILSLFIGIITWVALSILGLPYAVPLAILAGLLEIVPTLGPIIASIPAIMIAFTISPTMAIIVIAVYIVIQMLENNLLVPKIMQRAVGLNPIVVILAVMIGANLMGVLGALLAVPFVSFIIVMFNSINVTEDSK